MKCGSAFDWEPLCACCSKAQAAQTKNGTRGPGGNHILPPTIIEAVRRVVDDHFLLWTPQNVHFRNSWRSDEDG